MKRQLIHKIIHIILLCFGVALTAYAVFINIISYSPIGILFTYIAGLFFLLCGVFYNFLCKKIPLVLRCVVAGCVVLEIAFIAFLNIYGSVDSVTYKEDAVIVLGAGVQGEKVSLTLKNRLDRAVEYYSVNPHAVIVVSGGQGYGEDITEALAMERYLLENGIPDENIIKEENATSTAENFKFSKELLDEYFNRPYTVAYITNDFHIYRAGLIASSQGFRNATYCHSSAPFYMVITNGIRESLAVMYQWVFA